MHLHHFPDVKKTLLVLVLAAVPTTTAELLHSNGLREWIVCCDRPGPRPSPLPGSFKTFNGPLAADNFLVDSNEWEITEIGFGGDSCFDAGYFPEVPRFRQADQARFEIVIYDDNPLGGGPGEVVWSEAVVLDALERFQDDGKYTVEWSAAFRPIVLRRGYHWISIQQVGKPGDGFCWFSNPGGSAMTAEVTDGKVGEWQRLEHELDFTLRGRRNPPHSKRLGRTDGPRD